MESNIHPEFSKTNSQETESEKTLAQIETLLSQANKFYLANNRSEALEILESVIYYDGSFLNGDSEKLTYLKKKAQEMSEYFFIDEF